MIGPAIVNMINRKKLRASFAALYAPITIGSKDFITKLITPSLLISTTLIANQTTRFSWTSKALATHTSLPFHNRTLSILPIPTVANFTLLFRRFSKESITVLLNDLLIMRKVVIVAARFARNAKTTAFSMPVLGGFREIAVTIWAMLLSSILEYPVHTVRVPFLSSPPEYLQHRRGNLMF